MFGKMVSNMLFKPGQAPLFDSPSNYDLAYEDVEFKASDGVTLRGWLIPGDTDKVIIQSHFGTMCCRAGYTNEGKGWLKGYDEDIHFLNQAKYLHEAGFTVLMYDFRGHGESDSNSPPWITWGTHEAKDVVAAVDFIATHPVYKDASVGLLSICMGQGASTEAFGLENGLRTYPQIKAMVSVQPLDYPTFAKAMGLPSFVRGSVRKVMQKRTGLDFEAASWFPHAKDISVPTLVIQNRNDGYLDEAFVESFFDKLNVEKEMAWIEIPKKKNANQNRMAAYEWIGKNPEQILIWFGKYL
ncbi:alpha/beta hydrolase [Ruegeria sp.]|uniref:alpha/beta hydrolase n=1 Tax=Ruegeria sp. TaxID=1879320 RepID=UPI00230AB4CE|nr:alpha/beta hydrolase [Ruegeria sp.]MDA7966977.1 alpha/beta hydrolase [Ruegeria sp.]